MFSRSPTGGLRLKVHGDCHECVAESPTLSKGRVANGNQVKAHELVRFVALRSNWFYFLSEYVATYATTTSVFTGTTFEEAVRLTTIFSHRFCTNVVNGRKGQGGIEILPEASTVTTITICGSYRNCYYG